MNGWRLTLAVALLPLAAPAPLALAQSTPPQGETSYSTMRYGCERGVEIPVTYINAPDKSLVVLTIEGRQITLEQGRSASGVRYVWPSGGSNYVWWTKGNDALLLWHDGATGDEQMVYEACRAK